VLRALGGTGIRVSTGFGRSEEQGLRAAAAEAAGCLERLERRQHTALMLLSDGLSGGRQMEVVRGAYDVATAEVPLVGGCAGDYLAMRSTQQLHDREVLEGAVVAAAISSDRRLGVGVSHGWTPVGEPMLVTGSRGTQLSPSTTERRWMCISISSSPPRRCATTRRPSPTSPPPIRSGSGNAIGSRCATSPASMPKPAPW